MTICNTSKLVKDKDHVKPVGLPTEAALKVLVEKIEPYDTDFTPKDK